MAVHIIESQSQTAERLPPKFDRLMRDLRCHAGIRSALIAGTGPGGVATILAGATSGSRLDPGAWDFVSRATRTNRALAEVTDPAHDPSLDDPVSGARSIYAIS